jgi:hypothetical protein
MNNFFELLPLEIFKLITDQLNLGDLPNLSQINKYLNSINFAIESKIDHKSLPTFLLLDKWTNMLYLENPNFVLSKFANTDYNFDKFIIIEIILRNLINGLKLFIDVKYLIPSNYSPQIINLIRKDDYFHCNKNIEQDLVTVNKPLLVLTLLYGTKEMLIFLLNSNIINDINNNKIINFYDDKKSKYNDNSQNMLGFINNMEIKNNWGIKQIYNKVTICCIIEEIKDNNIILVKRILENCDKNLFEHKPDIKTRLEIDHLIENLSICNYIKVKYSFLIISNFGSIINKIKNWYYSESMLKTIFDCLEWSEEDIKFIIDTDNKYNFGIVNKLNL